MSTAVHSSELRPAASGMASDHPAPTVAPSGLIQAKLAALRRKHVAVAVLTGICMALAVAIELLALVMFLDWWLELPWLARLFLLVAQGLVLAAFLTRLVLIPIIRRPQADELALMMERAWPEFRGRLIAAVQLTRPGAIPSGASTGIVEAMIEQTEAMAAPLHFGEIVPTDKLKRIGLLAGFVLVLGVAGLLIGKSTAIDLLERAFLSNIPVPRKTRVIVIDGNKRIGRGDAVRLEAYARGIRPSHGKVEVWYRGRRKQQFVLEQDKTDRTRFGRTLESVQDSFEYSISLNDGVSPRFQVTAVPRPSVSKLECEQEFPAYTGMRPRPRPLGDLSLLAGSRLKLQGEATRQLQAAALKLVGATVDLPLPLLAAFPGRFEVARVASEIVPLTIEPDHPARFAGQLIVPPKGLSGFSVLMLDKQQMESRDAAVYRVEIIPDKVPVVRILYPDRKEELVTRQATLLLSFEAVDDFEISAVRLRYKVDTVEAGAERAVELELSGQAPQRLRRRYKWKIGAFNPPLPEASIIEYWIEVVDNNNATGPGVGSSEHQYAKVVSEAQKRADLLNRAGDYLGSITDVAADQEKLNRNLGAIIREKTGW